MFLPNVKRKETTATENPPTPPAHTKKNPKKTTYNDL